MKRKISILLSAVMIAGAMPMNVMAESTNSISGSQASVLPGEEVSAAGSLIIKPTSGDFWQGGTFTITLENAKFYYNNETERLALEEYFNKGGFKKAGQSVNTNLAYKIENDVVQYLDVDGGNATEETAANAVDYINKTLSNGLLSYIEDKLNASASIARIPFKIEITGEKTANITLPQFNADQLGGLIKMGGATPYIEIPLAGAVVAGDSGEMKVKVESSQTAITEGTYTFGSVYANGASTTASVEKITVFNGGSKIEGITVKENVLGTLKNVFDSNSTATEIQNALNNKISTRTITLRASSGFMFEKNSSSEAQVSLTGVKGFLQLGVDTNGEITASSTSTLALNEGFILSYNNDYTEMYINILDTIWVDAATISQFTINNVKMAPIDEDKNFGDVKVTISSGSNFGITRQTIDVAKRQVEPFTMSLVNEATTIIAGRTSVVQGESGNSNLDAENFVTAKVKFEENFANAWGEAKLNFNLPEGVQIVGVEFTKTSGVTSGILPSSGLTTVNNITGDSTSKNTYSTEWISINNNGRTLTFNKNFRNNTSSTEAASIEMVLTLSVDAGYEGDITLSAAGAGAAAGEIKDLVIAKAIQPISVETTSTRVNLGYQSYNTADITITETTPGALIAGKTIILELDSLFDGQIAITSADVSTTSNELTIKSVENKGSKLEITIDNASYDNVASIKISNVQVGTTRSIPYGSYGLKVYGSAVINNYNKDYNSTTTTTNNVSYAFNNRVEYYKVNDYINLVTSTGTLDNVVKVTINEKTVLVNDTAYDMDVAPYIQASSNSTLVPLRFVSVALGLDEAGLESADDSSKISFDNNSKTATIYYGSGTTTKIIQFQSGSNIMKIDGTSVNMENGVQAEIKDGRMFVPFRALGQALGVNVSWDEETRTAIYNAN